MKRVVLIGAIILLIFEMSLQSFAAPYISLVVDKDKRYRYSPSLYEPVYRLDEGLSGVTDICVDSQDRLYAARTANGKGQVLVYGKDGEQLLDVGSDVLKSASGVFVTDDGNIYIVDYADSKIRVFDIAGNPVKTIGRPVSPLYGKNTPFKPVKIAVDRQGNQYIISEGTTNGIVQLNDAGEFQGFFGPNLTQSTFFHELQKRVFTEEMMQYFIKTVPSSMSNIDIDEQGIVYATTRGDTKEPLKKINIAGKNILPDIIDNEFFGDGIYLDFKSVAVDRHGNMMALSGAYGQVFLFDQNGNAVGLFGASREGGNNELGITTNPVDIAVDSSETIYIADAAGSIQVFEPTPLMAKIYDALALYGDGRYLESEALWDEVIMRNSSIGIAYAGLGESALKRQQFAEAMELFQNANDRKSYSDAFWEVRQSFLLNYVVYVIIALILLKLAGSVYKRVTRHKGGEKKTRNGFVASQFRSAAHVLKHPRDTFYDLRFGDTISIWTAAIIIIAALVLRVVHVYTAGFPFNNVNIGEFQPLQKTGNDILILFLFVVANYLVASIRDGEGTFAQVVKGTALSLLPLVLLEIPLLAVSNILTLQEIFVYQFIQWFMYGWCLILIFCMIMEIHAYTIRETIVNLLLTVFVMLVLFVAAVVVYMLGKEFVTFFKSLIEEVLSRG